MPPIPSPGQQPAISVTPTPPVAPAPAPVAPAVASSNVNIVLVIAATVMASLVTMTAFVALLIAVVHFGGLWPSPSPPVATDFRKLGAEYGKLLGPSYAPAWKSYAADLRAGKTMADAVKNMNAAWTTNREAVYSKFIAPELSRIVPDGTPNEQVTPTQRAALAAAADALAEGLGIAP